MANGYYEFLGLGENATDEEIQQRYEELKAKYSEERWLSGEAGNEAAQNLTKLESIYSEVMSERKQKQQNTSGKSAFDEISELLKNGDITTAQEKLDAFNERNAEWHYLQAVVFYKKNWTNESKKQLEIAMEMDKDNKKYREAYGKLNAKNNYTAQNARPDPSRGGEYTNVDNEGDQMGGNVCSNCISCCYTYLCVDCLFSLCCGCR